jgi:hypothetical protein
MTDLTPTYSLAEIRDGTGFTKAARFVQESDYQQVVQERADLIAALRRPADQTGAVRARR